MMRDALSLIRIVLRCIIIVNRIISIGWPVTLDFAADGRMVTLQAPADLAQR